MRLVLGQKFESAIQNPHIVAEVRCLRVRLNSITHAGLESYVLLQHVTFNFVIMLARAPEVGVCSSRECKSHTLVRVRASAHQHFPVMSFKEVLEVLQVISILRGYVSASKNLGGQLFQCVECNCTLM
jgi:hypothetical protein